MDTTQLLEFDRKHLWHPYASMTEPPPVNFAVSASGTKIRLADGSELLDGVSSWWCMCHGHNHPKIVAAIREQAAKLSQVMFAGFTHEPAIRLAQLLVESAPAGLTRVFYADSGSVAVECAAKMALQYQLAAGRGSRRLLGTVRAPIVQVCDAISGARPGARREIVEAYIKRLNDLEQLAMSYPGVTKTYAIQAGRELRVIVGADKIDDKQTESLSGEIAKKIQDEMTYPGQVKITVIRETRAVSFAK